MPSRLSNASSTSSNGDHILSVRGVVNTHSDVGSMLMLNLPNYAQLDRVIISARAYEDFRHRQSLRRAVQLLAHCGGWTCSDLVDTHQAALSVLVCRDSYAERLL